MTSDQQPKPEDAKSQPPETKTPTPPAPAFVPTPPVVPTPTPEVKGPTRTPLFEAMNATRYARQTLIREIEATTGTTLICYVSEKSEIDRSDTVPMVDLLHNIQRGTPIDLLLNSPGGNIDAAEKLITLIRRRAGNAAVRVIVPDYAKSAATLIALGANSIVMSDASELGIIDPQVPLHDSNGNLQVVSAQSYLDAFQLHSGNLKKRPKDPVALAMLAKLEPATVRKLERMTERSRSIAVALLTQSMIKDADEAKEVAKELSNTERWFSHGQMISHEAAVGLNLNVTYLPPDSPLWEQYWRLYCLQLWAYEGGTTKIFESNWASLTT
jgi:hypothetical protein